MAPPKRNTSFWEVFSFCVCVRRTQHSLAACGQHHFERSENIVFNKRTQNEVALRQTVLCFASTMFCCWQKRCCVYDANTRLRMTMLHLVKTQSREFHGFLLSILFICCFKTRFIYCDKERSSYSAFSFNFAKISLSIVILIFSFKGFKTITS